MSCPDHIIDDVEKALDAITTAFKLAHDFYDTIIHIGGNPDLNKDVAALQASLDRGPNFRLHKKF
ncbi:hypothetical protein QCA50_004668 [Cerrena zonata]|uniref:Uncharacterized protein n=1 Tax=Cerrena zonata TaxID=2478898 RepID=A0AAW0GD96_9APHY